MAIETRRAEDSPALLSVRVQTVGMPDARLSGSILQNVSQAYRAFAVRRYGRKVDTKLVVQRITISSLDIDFLAVAQALSTLWDQREIVGGFVTHISEAIGILLGSMPQKVPKETKKLLQSTANAVTEKGVINITFNNSGTINGDVSIGPEIAQTISEALKRKADSDSEGHEALGLPNGSQPVALPRWGGNYARLAPPPLALPPWEDSTTKSPTTGKELAAVRQPIFGNETTAELLAYLVHGVWYGRIEGSEVLLPLFVSSLAVFPVALEDGKQYRWRGVVRTDRDGAPCAIIVSSYSEV